MDAVIRCKSHVPGRREGQLLITSQPISLWGGVDPQSGIINDPYHELFGESIAGKVLAFPYGKGSAGAPLVLMELVRAQKAPAAFVQLEVDPLLVSGPILCKHFYGEEIPVVTMSSQEFLLLEAAQHAVVDGNKGEIIFSLD